MKRVLWHVSFDEWSDDSTSKTAMLEAAGRFCICFGYIVSVCYELFTSSARPGGCLEGGCDGWGAWGK